MSEARSSITRFIIIGGCLAFTVLGLINTYGDNSDVVARAKAATCSSGDCSYQMQAQKRSPFEQGFTFMVTVKDKGRERSATADVECTRAYILIGDYNCHVTGGGLPGVSPAPASSPSHE